MTTLIEAVYRALIDDYSFSSLLATSLYTSPHNLTAGSYSTSHCLITYETLLMAPDGSLGISVPRDNSALDYGYVYHDATVVNDTTTERPFVYLKSGTTDKTRVEVNILGGSFVDAVSLTIDWTTSPPSIFSQSNTESRMDAVGDGWYKITVPIAKPGTGGTTLRTTLYPAGKTLISDIGTVYAWGFDAFTIQPKVYALIAPQEINAPYMVIQKAAQTRENTMADAGGAGVENGRYRLIIYADTLGESETIAEQARIALMAAQTSKFKALQVFNISNYEDDTHLYQVIVDYSIWYRH